MVGLFDFVEQHHRVGPAADGFGQLAAFLVADVAGRRADQARDGVLLLVLRHVDANHGALVVEQELGQGAGQLGFADAGGAEEDEAADGTVGILQAGAGADDGLGHGGDGFVLADDALVQLLFQVQQLLHFAFQQAGDGNAGPAADHLGDVLFVNLFLDQAGAAQFGGFLGFLLQLAFERHQLAVFQLGGAVEIVLPLGLFDFVPGLLDLLAQLAHALDGGLFGLPAGGEGVGFGAEVGQLLFQALPGARARRRSFSLRRASRSISSCMMRRRASSSSAGMESISVRRRAAASSTRSMALSGRKRSVM